MYNLKFFKNSKIRILGLFLSMVLVVLLLVASIFFLFLREGNSVTGVTKTIKIGTKAVEQKRQNKTSDVKLDVEKEKQILANAGFAISRKGLPVVSGKGGLRNMDKRYNFSLKDYVFNTNTIVKGKVIGTRSFIDNNIVRSEVKLVVEDSLMGTLKKGEIFTFVATGGVITEYEFWKMKGNKFKLSNNELEKAKKKLVVADVLSTLIYPEDEMYVFVGKDKLTISSTREQAPWVSFQIKYTGGKIDTTTNFEDQTSFYAQELRAMNSVEELNSLLKKMILEKKGYSQEKVMDTAYNEVSKMIELC